MPRRKQETPALAWVSMFPPNAAAPEPQAEPGNLWGYWLCLFPLHFPLEQWLTQVPRASATCTGREGHGGTRKSQALSANPEPAEDR